MAEIARKINARPAASLDGVGWWWEYITRLVKSYPAFTRQFVLDELPMIEGWLWYAQAITMDGWLSFNGVRIVSDGYIKQQTELLVKTAHEAWEKK